LGDISTIKNGKQLDKKNIINGIYPVYSGGLKPIGYHNIYNNENATIIAGTGHCGFVQFDDGKFYASQCFTIKSDNILLNKYLFIICKSLENIFMNSSKGSCQNFIRSSAFIDMLIPIPKTEELINKWVSQISGPYDMKQQKEIRFNELEEEIKNKIKDIQENHECEQVKLGDICEFIKTGKNKTPDDKKGTLYPYYGTSNITGYTNYYLFDGHFILLARNGTMGNCFLVKGKIYPSDHIFIIKNNKHIDIMLLYYIIKNLSSIIDKLSNGSTIKGISKVNLENIKIKLPKDKSLIDNLQPLFNEIEELQKEIKELDETYNNQLKELGKEAIKNQEILNTKEIIEEELKEEPKEEEIQEETTSIKSNKSQTIEQLKEQCKTLGIKGYSKKKKDELIELIKNHK
jgi:restriction endonuclease S subunit